MKKIFQYSMMLMLAVAGLASCTSDYDYDPASVSGNQVFFSNELASTVNLSQSATSFTIPLSRYVTDGELTVPLKLTDESGLFSVPASVVFAAGEATKDITVSYDPEQFTYEDYKTVSIAVGDESYTTPYGRATYSFRAGVPSPLKSLGKAKFADYFVMDEPPYEVEIMQNTLQPNVFRLVAPYDEAIEKEEWPTQGNQSPYIELTLLQPGDKVGDVEITQENLVMFNYPVNTGFYNTNNDYNQDILLYHPSAFTSMQDESLWLYSRVVAWQENGLPGEIHLAPYYYMSGIGGWNQTQSDGYVTIIFPGYEPKDYSLEFVYDGRFTDIAGTDYAEGTITMGEDLTSVLYKVVDSSEDVNAVADGLADGTIEGGQLLASGTIREPMEASGKYTVVVVGFDGDDAVTADAFTFKFQSSGETAETWTPIYIGTYVYGANSYAQDGSLFFDQVYTDEGLTLYVSDSNESRYKIVPFCDSEEDGLIFEMDDETGVLTVDEVSTGIVDDTYGEIFVSDFKTYGAANMDSYYDSGVFHFLLAYHVPAGVFAYVEDTFTLTAEASAKPAKLAPRKVAYKGGRSHRSLSKHISHALKIATPAQ